MLRFTLSPQSICLLARPLQKALRQTFVRDRSRAICPVFQAALDHPSVRLCCLVKPLADVCASNCSQAACLLHRSRVFRVSRQATFSSLPFFSALQRLHGLMQRAYDARVLVGAVVGEDLSADRINALRFARPPRYSWLILLSVVGRSCRELSSFKRSSRSAVSAILLIARIAGWALLIQRNPTINTSLKIPVANHPHA
jgi:hypothetical protein